MRRELARIEHAVGALRRRAGRNVAIALGIALVVALFASVLFLTGALRRELSLSLAAMPDITVQRTVAGRPALIDASVATALRELPAVRSVKPRVWGYYFVEAIEGNLTVIGVDPADRSVARDLGITLASGRALRPGAPREAVLGRTLADRLGMRVGDHMAIPVEDRPYLIRVVGIFDSASALHTADVLLTSDADARALLSVPEGQAVDLAIDLTTPDEAGVVAGHAQDAVPSARVLDKRILARTYELTFGARGGLLAAVLLPCLAALLLLAWDRLTGLSEAERHEIGVLKAVGWETSDVLRVRMWEAAAVALLGAALGIVLAYLWVFYAGAPGLSDVLFGWSALYPPLDLVPSVSLLEVLVILGAVVVPFIAVSVVPAWRAATIDPDQAMRGAS